MKKNLPKISIMKKTVLMFTLAAFMVACNSNPKTEVKSTSSADSVRLAADTAGLAQFQAWKAQNEMANANQYNNGTMATSQSTNNASSAPSHKATKSNSVSNKRTVYNSESSNSAQASKKKGWSKAAKGAAIGGGAGAVIGAVVNKKNRVAGGVIGGAVGAGVGYGIGRSKDKKDGRH